MTTYVEHVEHGDWQRTGRCVYCGCGARLFEGNVPADRLATARALDALADAVRQKTAES